MRNTLGIKLSLLLIAGWIPFLSLFCNQPPTELIEIIQPAGGERFKVDDAKTVAWRISDVSVISSIGVKLSIDNGKTYSLLLDSALPARATSMNWTITSDQVSDNCIIKVYDYSDESVSAKSGIFSVLP